MIASNRTSSWALALRQLLFRVFTDIVSTTLPLMTWFAEMSVSPAKPLCNTTTKFTFKLNEIFSMFGTILNRNITTSWTYQFLRFERTSSCISLVHSSYTIFSSSKVGFLALEAQKVGVDDHSILLRLSIIRRAFIFQLRITLLQFLELQSIMRHLLNFLIKILIFNCKLE